MRKYFLLALCLLFLFTGCKESNSLAPTGTPPPPILETAATSATSATLPPAGTPTASPTAVLSPTATVSPTPTLVPTIEPTPTATPLPWGSQVIDANNASQLETLVSWGKGRVGLNRWESTPPILAAGGKTWLVTTPFGLYLYQADPFKELAFLPDLDSYTLTPDNQQILASYGDRADLEVWDLTSGKQTGVIAHASGPVESDPASFPEGRYRPVTAIDFSPDLQQMAVAYGDLSIGIYNTNTWEQIKLLQNKLAPLVFNMVFSPDLQYLATDGGDTAAIWQLSDGKLITRRPNVGSLSNNPFSPNMKMFASGDSYVIEVWGFPDLTLIKSFPFLGYPQVKFSDDGYYLIVNNEQVRLLENGDRLRPDNEQKVLEAQKDYRSPAEPTPTPVLDFDFLEGAGHSSGYEGVKNVDASTLTTWGFLPDQGMFQTEQWSGLTQKFPLGSPAVGKPVLSDDGRQIAVCLQEDLLVQPVDGSPPLEARRCRSQGALDFYLETNSIAQARTSLIDILSLADGALEHTLYGHTLPVTVMEYSPDGKYLASATDVVRERSELLLWKVEPYSFWQRWKTNSQSSSPFSSLAWSPDGKLLAVGGSDDKVKLYRVWDGWLLAVLDDCLALDLEFSPDGGLLAGGCMSGTVSIWGIPDGTTTVVLQGHRGNVNGLSFSPDGKTLATASEDGTVRLWGIK